MRIKVCGMRENIEAVAGLHPDYMGFIFWEPSSRFLGETGIPNLPHGIRKVGVFVDETIEVVHARCTQNNMALAQLHGSESPEYCKKLKQESPAMKIIKAFAVDEHFDFSRLQAYEEVCDYFLFDTKGKLPGGNSRQFDWSLLAGNPSTKPYFLSGGIGAEEIASVEAFLARPEAAHCVAVDVNSRFENAPGEKKISELENFMIRLRARKQNQEQ